MRSAGRRHSPGTIGGIPVEVPSVHSAPAQLTNGTSWQIQEEWSSALGGGRRQ
jgi:hypothetical protein